MKKIKYLGFIFILFLVVGCGGKSSEEIFMEAYNNMEKLENYMLESTLKMDLSKGGSSFKMTVKSVSKQDEINKTSFTKQTGSFFGQSYDEQTYTMMKDNKKITYTKYGSIWYQKEEETDLKEEVTKVEEISMDQYQEITDEDIDGKLYKVTLTRDSMKNILGTDDSITLDYDTAKIYMVVKDQSITTIIMKVSGTMEIEDEKMDVYAEAIGKYSLKNKVGTVEIPSYIFSNAMEEEGYNTYLEVEKYLEAISYDVYYEESTFTYTNTESEYYEGTYPTEVNITIEDGNIGDGYIKMNGYLAKIYDGEISKFKFLVVDSQEKM